MSSLDAGLSIALMAAYLALPIALVWLPIYVGSRLNGTGIVPTYLCVLAATLVFMTAQRQGMEGTCGFSQSDCIGAGGFFLFSLIWFGAFAAFGGISAFMNCAKWRKARIGVL